MTYQKKTNEQGRSMVEMLGVLAIAGVLSVGGVSGYTTAMKKYRVNEILSGIRERALAVSAYQGFRGGTATDLLEYKDQPLQGYSVELYGPNKEIIGMDFAIQIGKLSQEICEQVASQGLESSILVRPNLCDAENDNIVIFGFKNTLEGDSERRDTSGELGRSRPAYQSDPCSAAEEGGIRCNGYVSEKCKMDANGQYHWVQKEMCLYGCSSGVCSTRKCIGNAQRCWDDEWLLECENGQWKEDKRKCEAICNRETNRCGEECGKAGDKPQVCWEETSGFNTYWRVYNCESDEEGRSTYRPTTTLCNKELKECGECVAEWERAQQNLSE